jgi:hypothetical protein
MEPLQQSPATPRSRNEDAVLGVQAISVLGKHVKSGNGTLRLIVFMGTAT